MSLYNLVSSNDRMPLKWQSYFCLFDGRKDICRLDFLEKYHDRYPEKEFFWMEEVRIDSKGKSLPKKTSGKQPPTSYRFGQA
jgi:hypothetical protein